MNRKRPHKFPNKRTDVTAPSFSSVFGGKRSRTEINTLRSLATFRYTSEIKFHVRARSMPPKRRTRYHQSKKRLRRLDASSCGLRTVSPPPPRRPRRTFRSAPVQRASPRKTRESTSTLFLSFSKRLKGFPKRTRTAYVTTASGDILFPRSTRADVLRTPMASSMAPEQLRIPRLGNKPFAALSHFKRHDRNETRRRKRRLERKKSRDVAANARRMFTERWERQTQQRTTRSRRRHFSSAASLTSTASGS